MPVPFVDEATLVISSWVQCLGITSGVFFVEFKAKGNKPKVCCKYPGHGIVTYQMALVSASKGRFVRQNLFRKAPYEIIACPCAGIIGSPVHGKVASTYTDMGATRIVVVTEFPHTLDTGDLVTIAGVTHDTGANGTWNITVISATEFGLNGAVSAAPGSTEANATWERQ